MEIVWEPIIKLVIAVVLGGVIGIEREIHHKPAGIRTNILVCLGATLATIISYTVFPNDPARMTASIIAGIGFLGAGAIIANAANVKGMTTAATIWAVAMVGIAVGVGSYVLAVATTIIMLLVLFFGRFEKIGTPVKKKP